MLVIDPTAEEPPFAQLRRQLAEQVAAGRLRPGERLPTVRRLAGDLGIAPNTVARAYRELEVDGILDGRGRAGTFVSEAGAAGVDPEALDRARRAARSYVEQVQALGLSPADALALARAALRG